MSYNTEQIDIILTEDDFKKLKESKPQYFDMLMKCIQCNNTCRRLGFFKRL